MIAPHEIEQPRSRDDPRIARVRVAASLRVRSRASRRSPQGASGRRARQRRAIASRSKARSRSAARCSAIPPRRRCTAITASSSTRFPVEPRAVNLLMWHSASAVAWQNRWDGGEGFQSIFLRRGFPVYVWDGPRVGRANWGCVDTDVRARRRAATRRTSSAWRFGIDVSELVRRRAVSEGRSRGLEPGDARALSGVRHDRERAARDRTPPPCSPTGSARRSR